jgi:hypoxanthine phosphoribosyltransferase
MSGMMNEPTTPPPKDQLSSDKRRDPLFITDDLTLDLQHFYLPQHYQGALQEILVPHGMIVDRVEKLASDITADYRGHTIHLVCVLKGGSTFFYDLCSALRRFHDYGSQNNIPYTFDFIRVKSYEGTESTGKVQISGMDVKELAGKHVLFVEDIIDTGLTMTSLLAYMNEEVKPASVRVASLVEKRTVRSCGFKGDYVGFSIPDKFIVGYCLDFNEVFRDLNHIGVISKEGFEKFKDHKW